MLKKAGYVTGMIGKSHLGSQTKFMPTNRGFDEFFVRKGNWKYVNLNRKRTFLFNLQEDVGEKRDLSKDKPDIVAELEKALAEWEAQTVEPLWPSRGTVQVNLDAHGLSGGTYELFI